MATAVVFVAYLSATIPDVAVALVKIVVAVMTTAVVVDLPCRSVLSARRRISFYRPELRWDRGSVRRPRG